MRSPYIALPLLLGLLAAGAVRAEGVMVPLDHSTRISLHGSASSVVVGNTGIADVSVVDSHTLYVTGRAMGSTDVAVVDPLGRTIFNGEVTVMRPATSVTLYRGIDRVEFSCGGSTCEGTDRAQPSGASKPDLAPGNGVSGVSTVAPHP